MLRINAIGAGDNRARKPLLLLAAGLILFCLRPLAVHAQGVQVDASVALPGVEVSFTANDPPPPLPVYEQPEIPGDGYLWTPGYWSWGDDGYYWVPGTWVEPPQVGLLWTPGYWAFADGAYGFHPGYWGPTVGFYGGVNYGFGYVGVGFAGGRWDGGHFAYNTAVMHVNTTIIHNTYNQTVINNNVTVNRVSFNGGPGGVSARPTAAERAAASERHIPPTSAQTSHIQQASHNPSLAAKANGGHPAIAATARPGVFSGAGVVAAHEAGRPAPANNAASRTSTPAVRANPSANTARPVEPRPAPARPTPATPAPARSEPVRPDASRTETPSRPVPQERPVPQARPTQQTERPVQQEHPVQERAEQPKPAAPKPAAPRPAPKPEPKAEPEERNESK
jgi:hypothetical protein